jgi:hypothetical protein
LAQLADFVALLVIPTIVLYCLIRGELFSVCSLRSTLNDFFLKKIVLQKVFVGDVESSQHERETQDSWSETLIRTKADLEGENQEQEVFATPTITPFRKSAKKNLVPLLKPKTPAKKTPVKRTRSKTPAKKTPAKKTPAKKSKSPSKSPVAKKTPASKRKAAAKKENSPAVTRSTKRGSTIRKKAVSPVVEAPKRATSGRKSTTKKMPRDLLDILEDQQNNMNMTPSSGSRRSSMRLRNK